MCLASLLTVSSAEVHYLVHGPSTWAAAAADEQTCRLAFAHQPPTQHGSRLRLAQTHRAAASLLASMADASAAALRDTASPRDAASSGGRTGADGSLGADGSRSVGSDGIGDSSGSGASRASNRPQPADQQQTRCCRGLTYFSQAMLETDKLPACIGLPTAPARPPDLGSVPPETVPNGDFKYVCLGYSLYREAQLRESWREAKAPGAPLQVPYCEGIEVVAAADTSPARAPMLLKEGLDPGSPPPTPVTQPPEPPRQPRPRFAVPPRPTSPIDGVDWSAFPERFSKTAGMIAERMGTNFNYMASTAKQAAQRIADVVSGSGRRGGQ